jgi:adenine-specific DNA-methyltransferase
MVGGEKSMTDVELRQAIAGALKRFQIEPLADAATHLWDVLGYASNKRLVLKPNTLSNFLSMFSHGRTLNDRYAKPDDWKSVDFLFQLTDEEVRTSANQKFDFESKGAYNGTIINSYLFFAIELKGSHYSRTALAGITREVNKLFDMPALILFRHGNTLTLAIINRRLHKREAGKDVLEKVTLIQDIEFTKTHRAHIDILSDLSIGVLHRKHPFSNFVGLHEAWQKTLDTSELNKRFFQDLANWYFWALPQVRFPKDAPKDADGQDSLSLIRLITRVIFCWFLKEKGLLPEALFDEHEAPALLSDPSPKESTYYKAILQNLFFATLNQEMDKRELRKSGQNFMAHNLYRYKSLMKTPSETLKLLEAIPFMNGGLFECLDKRLGTKEAPKDIRIDGFSDRDDNVLKVPNDLFWGPERIVDLSDAYGENRYRNSKVAGLVRIFNRYKFTVAENTPIEEEVALDPELLGRVFENLLAAYNPETGATARKQTGSFYTPREIVNYMVDESLIASLKSKMAEALPNTERMEERLRQLFAYNDQAHKFTEPEVVELIKGIDKLTILDPACGSGAFPMGILHKLVFVLGKLDTGNLRWKAQQIAKANEFTDSTVREFAISQIEQAFQGNELDYGRKLYLIENCIYGVDIQPIAVQISKLRFFISLVVEQTIHPKAENQGIRPLPNLETKFVASNALLGVNRSGQQLLRDLDVQEKETELRHVRERHFLARTPATKTKYREQDANLRSELAGMLRNDGWDSATAKMLAAWDPYDQNASAPFFDAEWMFGQLSGFDVVIANPPYISVEKFARTEMQTSWRQNFKTYASRGDIYCFFYEKGLELLHEDGVLTFISSNKFQRAGYGKGLRQLLASQQIELLIDFCELPVFDAATDPMIVMVLKRPASVARKFPVLVVKNEPEMAMLSQTVDSRAALYTSDQLKVEGWSLAGSDGLALVEKLRAQGMGLGKYVGNRFFRGIISGYNAAFVIDSITRDQLLREDQNSSDLIKPWIRGVDIKRWTHTYKDLYVIAVRYGFHPELKKYPAILKHLKRHEAKLKARGQCMTSRNGADEGQHHWLELDNNPSLAYIEAFDEPKIVFNETSKRLHAYLDIEGNAINKTGFIVLTPDAEFVLAVMNSTLMDWFYRSTFPHWGDPWAAGRVQFRGNLMRNIPIPPATPTEKSSLAKLAKRAAKLADAGDHGGLEEVDREIDVIVYRLFGVSAEDIKKIDAALAGTRSFTDEEAEDEDKEE